MAYWPSESFSCWDSCLVLRDLNFTGVEFPALFVFGSGVAADYWAATEVPHTEVIITTSIASALST